MSSIADTATSKPASQGATTPTKPGELPKAYEPSLAEPRVRERWSDANPFHPDPSRVLSGEREPYCILIPPPNVTAALHIGHALNNTLQDVLARVHRMKGYETLWMPGTDHAGIATQSVVENRLFQQERKRRTDYQRDEFVARVQAWKDEYEKTITDQLRALGCSCDWDRQRFTMDDVCARAVREAFFRLFREKLIYRGKRLVNWDPVSRTALADDEVDMKEVEGKFYYLRYPLIHPSDSTDHKPVTWGELVARGYPGADQHPEDEQAWVTVATTRPETYLGDTAVAMNPKDPRAGSLRGLLCRLPLVGRNIPIVEDDYVVMPAREGEEATDPKAKFATGFLKVTPAHDPNDWEIGRRHNLPAINVMAPDATISDKHGWEDIGDAKLFIGLTREAAREKVIEEFASRSVAEGSEGTLLEKIVPYAHSVGHSYRSHVPIEPYLSDQWYCKVSDERLVGEAQRALDPKQRSSQTHPPRQNHAGDGVLSFTPARYAKTYEAWHDNLRDWCISRQLWWGHRIPVWSREVADDNAKLWERDGCIPQLGDPENATHCVHIEHNPDGLTATVHVCLAPGQPDDEKLLESIGFTQDPDVLDTWFSSALWPISTMGWPDPDTNAQTKNLLDAFNPSSVLVTGRDIITLWVSRMVMFNRFLHPNNGPNHNAGGLPFKDVYINPIIQDGHGQRMSKSLGNGVDPRDIIKSHGADALRYTLVGLATATQDVRLPVDMVCPHTGQTFTPKWITTPGGATVAAPIQDSPSGNGKEIATVYGVLSGQATPTADMPLAGNTSSKFDAGRNFCNKVWNAARFALSNLTAAGPEQQPTEQPATPARLVDRWMLSRLASAVADIDAATAEYRFSDYATTLYDLVWRDFCDWYLEAIKPTVKTDAAQRAVLATTLDAILRLLHPVAPFLTETLWESAKTIGTPGVRGVTLGNSPHNLLSTAGWPTIDRSLADDAAEQSFSRVQALVGAVREARTQHQAPERRKITLHMPAELIAEFNAIRDLIETLAGVGTITADAPAGPSVVARYEGAELRLSDLADALDPAAERARLEQLIAKLDKEIAAYEGRLNNPGYADKAPAKLVSETRDKLEQARAERSAASQALGSL